MKITEEAKSMLTETLVSNECDCLKAALQQSCCGTSLVFNLAKLKEGEKPILINGINVMMDDKAKLRADTVTIAVENGELIIQDDAPSCSC